MPVRCPFCGSRNLRYAHRRDLSERFWSLIGVRPLRCRDCHKRFVDRTWRLSSIRYARCPNCWRTDLNTWSLEDHRASTGQALLLRMGARPYRCEYCRINFVSFRKRLESFSFRRWRARKRHAEGEAAEAGSRPSEGNGSQEAGES